MRIWITGSGGFVGSRLAAYYREKYEVWAPTHGELDFTDERRTLAAAEAFAPDVVLHCGAVSDVAVCGKNPALSMAVNVAGTRNLARACARVGSRFVFCSSDQVYFRARGQKEEKADFLLPHRETEAAAPIPLYGQHKLLAERYAFLEQPDSVVLRLTWMYGKLTEQEQNAGRSNLLTVLEAAVHDRREVAFSDTDYRGVTDIADVVRHMEAAWKLPAGIYNYGSSSGGSMYETVRRAMERLGAGELVHKTEGGTLRNLVMDGAKLEAEGIRFPEAAKGLCRALGAGNIPS